MNDATYYLGTNFVDCGGKGGGEPRRVVVNPAKDTAGKYDDVESVGSGGEELCC